MVYQPLALNKSGSRRYHLKMTVTRRITPLLVLIEYSLADFLFVAHLETARLNYLI